MKMKTDIAYSPKKRKIAVIGPLANEWFKDWNGGIPPYRISPYEGIRDAFGEDCVTYTDGKKASLSSLWREVCLSDARRTTGAGFALRG